MKKIKTSKGETLAFYSVEEVFAHANRSRKFQAAYEKELSRLHLAKQVRDARIAKKLTQKDLAERADMPQSVIARLESGTHSISVDTLERIAHVFGKKIKLV